MNEMLKWFHSKFQNDKDSGYDTLLLHIWCKAILRDRWSDISTDDPFESCKDTVFFKTLELAYTEGRVLCHNVHAFIYLYVGGFHRYQLKKLKIWHRSQIVELLKFVENSMEFSVWIWKCAKNALLLELLYLENDV